MLRQIALIILLASPSASRAAQTAATDRQDVIAVVQAYNIAGNRGDRGAYASYCTHETTIVDEVPPYMFQGPSACADEYDAVVAWRTENKIRVDDFYQKVFDPVSFDVKGDLAYAVFPARGSFSQDGRKEVENLYLTTVMCREAHGWRIIRLVYSTLGWRPARQGRR